MSRWIATSTCALAFVMGLVPSAVQAAAPAANLAANGSFERDADGDGVADDWMTAGDAAIEQQVSLDAGRAGGRSARLVCTKFAGDSPSSHVMLCQVGKVAVKHGRCYRLTWWAKGNVAHRPIKVSLTNMRPWRNAGLNEGFVVTQTWRRFEQAFQATEDLPARDSRLQFWFGSTGTLWLDDVVLIETNVRPEHHPHIATDGMRNLIPNSSFECGPAGWGSYAPDLKGWTGNVYRLIGEIDDTTAAHGKRSLRIQLTEGRLPVFFFDYYGPIEEKVRAVLAAHVGWLPLDIDKSYTLSCALKADRPDVAARLMVRGASGESPDKTVRVGTDWRRFALTVRAKDPHAWAGVGLDLEASGTDSARLWVDAVQFESQDQGSAYAPRSQVETFIDTPVPGNIFTDPAAGLTVRVVAWNGTSSAREVRGRLKITDFFDREVLTRDVKLVVRPGRQATLPLKHLLPGRRGFYRVEWRVPGVASPYPLTLRCAVIDAYDHADSPFGMNHAYPWAFLLRLGKQAGLTWHRDWSVKWQTVQPEPGPFSFLKPDAQIDRVLDERLNVLVMFPAPSALWSSAGDQAKIERITAKQIHRRDRYIESCPPKRLADFCEYIAQSVKHYRDRVRYYEIFNEPLYTIYAVPCRLGYRLPDYLELLEAAYETIKKNQPHATVVGGVPCWTNTRFVGGFIASDGMKWVDVLNLHIYPATIDPRIYEKALLTYRQQMRDRGQLKPMWLTEFGCYADDDPPTTPYRVGDAAMTRAHWDTERLASEALVKWAAVCVGNGVTKIFYHAGVCGEINGRDAGGIFFEYGGTPRKMYAALSALANLLGPEPVPVPIGPRSDAIAQYVFATDRGLLAIVWSADGTEQSLRRAGDVRILDMMGNPLDADPLTIGSTPIYLLFAGRDTKPLEAILRAIRQ